MKKTLKALTLIELIVAMGVFSIIMVGVMNMVKPVQEAASQTKIMNSQKNIEEAVVTYIGEQLRYSNSILIAEQGATYEWDSGAGVNSAFGSSSGKKTINSPKDAAECFLGAMGVMDENGNRMRPCTLDNGQYFHMIIWDGKNSYTFGDSSATYTGRMFSTYSASSKEGYSLKNVTALDSSAIASGFNTKPDKLYCVFGQGYYSTADLFLRIQLSEDGLLTLVCDSDYWYTAGAAKNKSSAGYANKKNEDSNNPTVATYQLRNHENMVRKIQAGPVSSDIKFMTKSGHGLTANTRTTISDGTGKIIYFCYTTDADMDCILYGERGTTDSKKKASADGSQSGTLSWGNGCFVTKTGAGGGSETNRVSYLAGNGTHFVQNKVAIKDGSYVDGTSEDSESLLGTPSLKSGT